MERIKFNFRKERNISYFAAFLLLITLGLVIYGVKEFVFKGDHIYKFYPNGAVCNDGTISSSQGSGTCSHHGGVKRYLYEKVQIGAQKSSHQTFFKFALIGIFIIIIFSTFNRTYRWKSISHIVHGCYFIVSIPMLIFVLCGMPVHYLLDTFGDDSFSTKQNLLMFLAFATIFIIVISLFISLIILGIWLHTTLFNY